MKKLLLFLLTPLLLLTGCSKTEPAFRRISMAEAEKMMNTPGVLLVDVRTWEEYTAGHIPGAVCIPVESISAPPKELPDKAQTILIYCRSGRRSVQAAEKLAALGYTGIVEIGGIQSWNGPLNTGENP